MAKLPDLTIDDVLKKFSFEEIEAAQIAKQKRELQPRKEKVLADFEALKQEVAAIRELDADFPWPWKKAGAKKSGSVVLVDGDLLRIQSFLAGESKQLKDVAAHLNVPWQSVRKFLKVYPAFKVKTSEGKSFVSYVAR
jgi:hypothetical protein